MRRDRGKAFVAQTAKPMEDNPLLVRLKELKTLVRIPLKAISDSGAKPITHSGAKPISDSRLKAISNRPPAEW